MKQLQLLSETILYVCRIESNLNSENIFGIVNKSVNVSHSVVSDSVTPWTVAHLVPPSTWIFPSKNTGMGCIPFSKDLPNSGIKPESPALQAVFTV